MGGDREYNNKRECYVKWLSFADVVLLGQLLEVLFVEPRRCGQPAEKTGPMAPIITFVARVQDGMLLVSVDCRAAAF